MVPRTVIQNMKVDGEMLETIIIIWPVNDKSVKVFTFDFLLFPVTSASL